MHDVLISGYYGFGNAGDEAILESTVRAFQKGGLNVAVLSHTPRETSKALGISAYERTGGGSLTDAIQASRLVLSGGGGLLQDTTSFRSLAYYLRIPMLAKRMGKKTMIFGQGIGPIRNPLGKWLTRYVCNRFVDRITVRDNPSRDLLARLGVKKEITVTADPAFLLAEPSADEIAAVRNRFHPERARGPLLGIILRNWPQIESHFPILSESISNLAKAQSATPVLIPFQPGRDESILESFKNHLDLPSLRIPSGLSHRELFALISSLDFVIGMRYHGLLFAARAGVPFLGLVYDEKVENLANSLGAPCVKLTQVERFPEISLHKRSTLSYPEPAAAGEGSFTRQLEQAWNERIKIKEFIAMRMAAFTRAAQTNLDIAIELLEKSRSLAIARDKST